MKTMTRQKTCAIPGCHRLPAAKGKCTHHLGLITNGQITSRHLRMKEETMAPRLTRAITKGAAWRMPGGHFRASRVNGSVWATWVEYDGVRS